MSFRFRVLFASKMSSSDQSMGNSWLFEMSAMAYLVTGGRLAVSVRE